MGNAVVQRRLSLIFSIANNTITKSPAQHPHSADDVSLYLLRAATDEIVEEFSQIKHHEIRPLVLVFRFCVLNEDANL
jgi:hypothetical protein